MSQNHFRAEKIGRMPKVMAAQDLNMFMPIAGEGWVLGNYADDVREKSSMVASCDVEYRRAAYGLSNAQLDIRNK